MNIFKESLEILPTGNPLLYISPSSFMTWRMCQYKYYLMKRSGYWFGGDTGIPAAMGSTFDAFVKRWLAHKLGIADHPKVHSSSLLGKINFPSGIPREEIERAAANVAELYINNGLAIQLIEEGLYDVELNIFMPFGEDFTILGLPIVTGKPGGKINLP